VNKLKNIKRIVIIGLPGSGKSTLASIIGQELNIPAYHLDNYVFENGKGKRDLSELIQMQKSLVEKPSWIIDGCSIKTLELRVAKADIVLYLQFSRTRCIWRLLKRFFITNKQLTHTGCAKVINWTLLHYTWNFVGDKHEKIKAVCNRYPHVPLKILRNPTELKTWLNKRFKDD